MPTTSLLGTGVFALPDIALAAGDISLWAWPRAHYFDFPYCIVFAVLLGAIFNNAGGVAYFCRGWHLARARNGDQLAVLSSFLLVFPQPAYCGGFAVCAVWLAKRTALIWGAKYL